MVYRKPSFAPSSVLREEQRGEVKGRFCHSCGGIFPLYSARHRGKPMVGKDHMASPCSHEGDEFEPEASWWEPAVEVRPAAAEPAVEES